jgi:hypothetical protein
MSKKIFYTLVKEDHTLGGNKYILGRISGIRSVLCAEELGNTLANMHVEEGTILSALCTDKQYKDFTKYVEERYPNLCIFNYTRR